MNLENLKYFLVAAEELNFTKAAEKLYITQQSLSKHIRKMEDIYGTPLFNRTSPMTLTASGLSLQRGAIEIMHTQDHIIQEINDIRGFSSSIISIGVGPTRGRYILPSILSAHYETHPKITIELFEDSSKQLEGALLKGKFDVSLGFLPKDTDNIKSIVLYTNQFHVVIAEKLLTRMAGDRADEVVARLSDGFDIELLRDFPVVMMSPNYKIGAFTRQLYAEQGLTPNILLETSNVDTALALCYEGLGYCLAPTEMIVDAPSPRPIRIIPVARPDAVYPISINYLKGKYMTKAIYDFIATAQRITKLAHR